MGICFRKSQSQHQNQRVVHPPNDIDQVFDFENKPKTNLVPGTKYYFNNYKNKNSQEFDTKRLIEPIAFHLFLRTIQPDKPQVVYQIVLYYAHRGEEKKCLWMSRGVKSVEKCIAIKNDTILKYDHNRDPYLLVEIMANYESIQYDQENEEIQIRKIVNDKKSEIIRNIKSKQMTCTLVIKAIKPELLDPVDYTDLKLTLSIKYNQSTNYRVFISFHLKYKTERFKLLYISEAFGVSIANENIILENIIMPHGLLNNDGTKEYLFEINAYEDTQRKNGHIQLGRCHITGDQWRDNEKKKLVFLSVMKNEVIGTGEIVFKEQDINE